MSTAYLQCSDHGRRLAVGCSQPLPPGAFEPVPGAPRPRQPNGYNILSGQQPVFGAQAPKETPFDLGLCKRRTSAKIAAPGFHFRSAGVGGGSSFFLQSFDRRTASTGPFLLYFRPP